MKLTLANVYTPNELVVVVRRLFKESTSVTTAFLTPMRFGVKTRPVTVPDVAGVGVGLGDGVGDGVGVGDGEGVGVGVGVGTGEGVGVGSPPTGFVDVDVTYI